MEELTEVLTWLVKSYPYRLERENLALAVYSTTAKLKLQYTAADANRNCIVLVIVKLNIAKLTSF